MAKIGWQGTAELEAALGNVESKLPSIIPDMLKSGARVLLPALKNANATFRGYWKAKKPKKNQYGWFLWIGMKGKTSSGERAALAAGVNEYGRQGYHPQVARPFIRDTIQANGEAAAQAMQAVFDAGMREAGL